VFPDIVADCGDTVRVWSAGCSCGEEAYSVAILWDQFFWKRPDTPHPEIWATDNNPEALARAEAGVYESSSLREVDQELRDKYFSSLGDFFVVSDRLRRGIQWMNHDIVVDHPPAREFHLILLRNNLLTYYQKPLQEAALDRVLKCLAQGGFLVVGAHERLPESVRDPSPCSWNRLVFRKQHRDKT